MQMSGLEEIIYQLAIDNNVCQYRHVVKKDKNNDLRKVRDLKITGRKKNKSIKENFAKNDERRK